MKKQSLLSKIGLRIKSVFLHGFFTLLPIAITFSIIRFGFRIIKSTLVPIYQIEPECLKRIPHSEIIIALMVIFILGICFDMFFSNVLHHVETSILNRIPLLRQVYFGAKQLVQALNPKDNVTFKTVVMMEYPRSGIYTLGFLTNEVIPHFSPELTGKYYSVFIPSVPNPATGYYIIVPEADCKQVNISRQDALALIISGGIIQPEVIISPENKPSL